MNLDLQKIQNLVNFIIQYRDKHIRLSKLAYGTEISISEILKAASKLELKYEVNPNYLFTPEQVNSLIDYFVGNLSDVTFKNTQNLFFPKVDSDILRQIYESLTSPRKYKTFEFESISKSTSVFRYSDWNNWARDSLGNCYIYHSDVSEFNDPFDCIVSQIPMFNSEDNSLENKRQSSLLNDFIKHTKVACFSLVKDSILMWSHYANNHKGICIEYDSGFLNNGTDYLQADVEDKNHLVLIKACQIFFSKLFVVKYVKNLVRNYDKQEINFPSVYLRKYQEWYYENEVRRVVYVKDSKNIEQRKLYHDQKEIRAIYLGTRVNEETLYEVNTFVKEKFNYHIPLYRAILHVDSFSLDFELIS